MSSGYADPGWFFEYRMAARTRAFSAAFATSETCFYTGAYPFWTQLLLDPMTNHGIPHMTKSGSTFRRLLGSAVLAASMMLLASPGQAQSGPFASLAGAWTGTGKILIKDGGSESIRCRATYTVAGAGAGLSQVLRCASDSYRFDLTTNVTASGSNAVGQLERDQPQRQRHARRQDQRRRHRRAGRGQRLLGHAEHEDQRQQADHRHPLAEHRPARRRHHADALRLLHNPN